MQSFLKLSAALMVAVVMGAPQAQAEPIEFEISGALGAARCAPDLPASQTLSGVMTWDPDAISSQIGGDYFPQPGTATIALSASDGFNLTLNSAVIGVQPGSPQDTFYNQSFLSEDPNGWNIEILLSAEGGNDGWLQGNNSLPESFPDDLSQGFISACFTDEFTVVTSHDARLCSITVVGDQRPPLPPHSPTAATPHARHRT